MESLHTCFPGRPVQSAQRFAPIIIASLLFAYVCANPHSMFVGHLSGRLPAVSALLAIGRLQTPSSLAYHASSTSMQLIRLYAPMLLGVALLCHHAVEAKLQVVTSGNFNYTSYYGSPVRLNGNNIFFTLDERASQSVTWKFNGDWQIQLEKKCDIAESAEFEISDSCNWLFDWWSNQFILRKGSYGVNLLYNGPAKLPPVGKVRIDIGKNDPPTMHVCAVTDEGACTFLPNSLEFPPFCMLAADPFSVNITNDQRFRCPINVTIINAQLLDDFDEPTTSTEATTTPSTEPTTTTSTEATTTPSTEPTTMPSSGPTTMPPTVMIQTHTVDVNPPLWTGTGAPPPGHVTSSSTSNTYTTPQNGGDKSVYSGLVLVAVVLFGSAARLLYDI